MEATAAPRRDKQNVVCGHDGILHSLKQEGDTSFLPQHMNSGTLCSVAYTTRFHSREVLRVARFIETESWVLGARDWGSGNGEILL